MTRTAPILAALCLVALSACKANHLVRYYAFEEVHASAEYDDPKVVVAGRFVEVSEAPRVTDYGNPYTVYVLFKTRDDRQAPRSIRNVRVAYASGQAVYTLDEGSVETSWTESPDGWLHSWTHDGLELLHEPLVVAFDLVFVERGTEVVTSFRRRLVPVYEERRSNTTWDGIMSV